MTNSPTDIPAWCYRAFIVALLGITGWLSVYELSVIDRRLVGIETNVAGMPVIQDRVAVLWKRAFGGRM